MKMFVNACVPEENAEAEKRWGEQIVMRSNAQAAVQLMESLEPVQLLDRLPSIKLPTLILHGSRDVITPVASAERLAKLLPNAQLHIIEGAGHVPIVTRPAQVAQAIDAFGF